MKPMNIFLLLTFALFLVGFALAGLLIAVGGPNYLFVIVQIVMAWTPTMAFAIIHRKVDPGRSFWRYVANRFAARIKALPLLASILIPVFATGVVWIGYSLTSGAALGDIVADLSIGAIFMLFVSNIIRGPLGEELGWRGYLLIELNKRYSLLRSSLIVGVIWGIWHLPLWFVSGYQGGSLLLYIVAFLAGIISFSVVIGYTYQGRDGNLLYAILLHQMFNFAGGLLNVDELAILVGSSVVYAAIALGIGLASIRSTRAAISTT